MASKFETTNTDEIRVLEGNEIDHVAGGFINININAILEQWWGRLKVRKWPFPTHRF